MLAHGAVQDFCGRHFEDGGQGTNVLDPGGFGAVTIAKSISIISTFEAGVLVSGTNGIIVNLPSAADYVLLEGLDIEGLGTGLNGIQIIGSGRVVVRKRSIRNFTLKRDQSRGNRIGPRLSGRFTDSRQGGASTCKGRKSALPTRPSC